MWSVYIEGDTPNVCLWCIEPFPEANPAWWIVNIVNNRITIKCVLIRRLVSVGGIVRSKRARKFIEFFKHPFSIASSHLCLYITHLCKWDRSITLCWINCLNIHAARSSKLKRRSWANIFAFRFSFGLLHCWKC